MEIGTARVGRTMSRTVVNHVFPLFLSFLCSLIFPLYEWPVGHTVTRSIRQYIRSSYVGRELHWFVAAWSSQQLEFYLFPLFEFQQRCVSVLRRDIDVPEWGMRVWLGNAE